MISKDNYLSSDLLVKSFKNMCMGVGINISSNAFSLALIDNRVPEDDYYDNYC